MTNRSLQIVDNSALVQQAAAPWYEVEATARRLYAPKANDAEWQLFLLEARELDLSPARDEYIALAIGKEHVNGEWRDRYSGYVTLAGVRALAMRTGLMDGAEGPFYAGPDGNFREFWWSDEEPVAARYTVFVKGMTRGFTGICTMNRAKTYVDRKDGNKVKLTPMWQENRQVMLAARAEMDAFRRSGLLQHPSLLERPIITYQAGAMFEVDDPAERTRSGKKLHAIAASRGIDHGGARAAVQSVDPGIESLTEADALAMDAAADQLDVFDAEGVASITGVDADAVEGEAYEVQAEPDSEPVAMPDGERMATAAQVKWLSRNLRTDVPSSEFTSKEQAYITGESAPTWAEADKLIRKMATLNALAESQGQGK